MCLIWFVLWTFFAWYWLSMTLMMVFLRWFIIFHIFKTSQQQVPGNFCVIFECKFMQHMLLFSKKSFFFFYFRHRPMTKRFSQCNWHGNKKSLFFTVLPNKQLVIFSWSYSILCTFISREVVCGLYCMLASANKDLRLF